MNFLWFELGVGGPIRRIVAGNGKRLSLMLAKKLHRLEI
jgi:hypothetical protein